LRPGHGRPALQQIDAVGFVIGQSQQLIVQLPTTPETKAAPSPAAASSAEGSPVDLDQPLAFLFGEGQESWHKRAADYNGEWLQNLLDSQTFDEYWSHREPAADKSFPDGLDDGRFFYDR
jgi:hypothetical protein